MILLSRLIKSQWSAPIKDEKKIISIKIFEQVSQENEVATTPIYIDKQVEEILNKANLQADDIIKSAKNEADNFQQQIVEEKQAFEYEKEKIAEQAREEGYSAGLEEGREKGYLEYCEIIHLAKEVVDSSKVEYRNHIESAEKAILDLGLKVAGKIIGKSLEDSNEAFISIVKRALKEARENQEVQLHVHPTYYDFLLANKEELIMLFPKEVDFYIYPDDELSESSCIIESANGRIDASIDSQLEEIKRKLFEMLEGE